MVIAVLSGTRPTDGYFVQIESVQEFEDRISVNYEEVTPGDGCNVAQVLTSPFVLVTIPQSDKPVQFESTITSREACIEPEQASIQQWED
jgi:hypothetical protein